MSESPRCPKCGIQLPADAPAGLCPICLVKAGFESQPAADSAEPGPTKLTPPASGFVPPSVEELAPLFPQLEILELLGKGGMGAVYKARQPGLDRLVAVKILPPEISHDPAFAERFQREARALARLSHPHIVAVYDFGETDSARRNDGSARRGSPDPAARSTEGLPSSNEPQETFGQPGGSVGDRPQRDWPQRSLCYIVMEFVDGANLRQAMRTGTLTSAEALAIVPQICEALQFAHDEGIVHRDIKPENILIDKRGRVKIADFGLAKLLGQDASDHSLTATHQVMGTLRYMAPEQMQGSREVDHRADIYSLGVVFYELLTGELPMGKFAPPSKKVQIDVRLDEIVLRALEADPEQRYQHASEVKTELDTIRTTPAQHMAAAQEAHAEQRTMATPTFANDAEASSSAPLHVLGTGVLSRIIVTSGIVTMLSGVLTILLLTGVFVDRNSFDAFFRQDAVQIPLLVMQTLAIPVGILMVMCGLAMRSGSSSLTRLGATLGIVPLTPGWLITMPLGLYVLIETARSRQPKASKIIEEREKTGTGPVPFPQLVQGPADCLLLAAGIAFVTACGVALWLGVTASSGNHFTTSMIRGNLIGMSVALTIYSVFVSVSGLMLRRLRARLFVLLVAVIVGLFFPAVCALNVVMELRNIPVWPVVIPLWLGMPAALWVVVTLFRDDVRGAFDAADEQRRLCDGSKPPQQNLSIASEPRFSRFALWGAILTVVSVLACLGFMFVGTVVFNHLFVTYYHPIVKPLSVSIAEWLLGTVGALAAIGAPLCGVAAISQIKKSNGKLDGLPLARGCVLCSPLLVLGSITFTLTHLACIAVWTNWPGPTADLPADTPPAGFPGYAFMVLDAIAALVVCFFVGRAVWRAIARHDKPVDQPSPALPGEKSGEPGGVSPRTGDEQVRGLTPSGSPSLRVTPRPKLVPVLATFNLVGAIVLMLACAMEEPAEFAKPMPRLWQVWEKVDAVLGFSMAAGMFAASIGLFLWKPWARKLTLGVCIYGLASVIFDAPYLARFALPDLYAEIQQTVSAESIDPDARDFVAMFTVVVLLGGMMVVALTWLIGQLVYFTRPRVVAAFESQGEKHGKFIEWLFTGFGAVVGVLSVFGPLALLLGVTAMFNGSSGDQTVSQDLAALRPMGTITNGIGVEFTVPAGQVATFEIVTRRDNETVPVPPHCGYVMATEDQPLAGQFRWSRKLEEAVAGSHSNWRIEMRTGGGGGGYSEATLLPDELNAAVGARGLGLGLLEPNEESIHWGSADVHNLPANGLIGLRVTVQSNGRNSVGSGTGHIDWNAPPTQSTSRRKFPDVAP